MHRWIIFGFRERAGIINPLAFSNSDYIVGGASRQWRYTSFSRINLFAVWRLFRNFRSAVYWVCSLRRNILVGRCQHATHDRKVKADVDGKYVHWSAVWCSYFNREFKVKSRVSKRSNRLTIIRFTKRIEPIFIRFRKEDWTILRGPLMSARDCTIGVGYVRKRWNDFASLVAHYAQKKTVRS